MVWCFEMKQEMVNHDKYARINDSWITSTSAAYRYSNDDVGTIVHDGARPHVACS